MIGQFRAESLEERERGVGPGKVLKLGFELGMPIAQRCCMLAHCPQGNWRRPTCCFLKENQYLGVKSGPRVDVFIFIAYSMIKEYHTSISTVFPAY